MNSALDNLGLTEGSKARELAKLHLKQVMSEMKMSPPRIAAEKQRRRWHQGVELAPMAGAKRETYDVEVEADYSPPEKPPPTTRSQPQWALDAMLSESKRSDDDMDADSKQAQQQPNAEETIAMLMEAARGLMNEGMREDKHERAATADREAEDALKAAMLALASDDDAPTATDTTSSALQIMLSAADENEIQSDVQEQTLNTQDELAKTLAAMDSFPELSLDSDDDFLDDSAEESFSETMDAAALQREMELLEEMEKLDEQECSLNNELDSQKSDLERILADQENLQKLINEKMAALQEDTQAECKE